MAFTAADLTAVETAIKSGELEVEYQDRRVKYRSMTELMKAYAMIKQEVTAPTSSSSRVAKQVRFATKRGFGE